MISDELFLKFKDISIIDDSEQIRFYEQYSSILENPKNYEGLNSRTEFINRIFILFNCSLAFHNTSKYQKSIEIKDLIILLFESNQDYYQLDLITEHYYYNTIANKGNTLTLQNKYKDALECYEVLMQSGNMQLEFIESYVTAKHSKLSKTLKTLNNYLFIFSIALFVIPKIFITDKSIIRILSLSVIPLFVIYFTNILYRIVEKKDNALTEKLKMSLNEIDKIEIITDKLKNSPQNSNLFAQRGIEYCEREEYEKSIKDLDKSIAINPNHDEALYFRAISYRNLSKYEKEIKDLSKLIELSTYDIADLHFNRGYSYMELNNKKKAVEEFNIAIRLKPYSSLYHFNKGYLLQTENKLVEAIDEYNITIQLCPEEYMAMTNRGEAYLVLGEKEKAITDFTKAAENGYNEAIENLKKIENYP